MARGRWTGSRLGKQSHWNACPVRAMRKATRKQVVQAITEPQRRVCVGRGGGSADSHRSLNSRVGQEASGFHRGRSRSRVTALRRKPRCGSTQFSCSAWFASGRCVDSHARQCWGAWLQMASLPYGIWALSPWHDISSEYRSDPTVMQNVPTNTKSQRR